MDEYFMIKLGAFFSLIEFRFPFFSKNRWSSQISRARKSGTARRLCNSCIAASDRIVSARVAISNHSHPGKMWACGEYNLNGTKLPKTVPLASVIPKSANLLIWMRRVFYCNSYCGNSGSERSIHLGAGPFRLSLVLVDDILSMQ
jgi:hypothetical protein